MLFSRLSLGLGLLLCASPGLAAAKPQVFKSGYTVSYLGFTLARSEISSSFEGDRYAIRGRLSSSGLASFFDSTTGGMKVSGRIGAKRAYPELYVVSYKTDEKKKRTIIRFGGNRVTETENVPPLRKRKNWVAVSAADLDDVSDPISGTLLRARKAGEVCGQTIRLFDGEMRLDLRLSPEGTEDWNGVEAVTCKARFVPVSGYRRDKRAIAFLRDRSDITIAFARLGTLDIYAPVRASIGTEIGTVTVSADAAAGTD